MLLSSITDFPSKLIIDYVSALSHILNNVKNKSQRKYQKIVESANSKLNLKILISFVITKRVKILSKG